MGKRLWVLFFWMILFVIGVSMCITFALLSEEFSFLSIILSIIAIVSTIIIFTKVMILRVKQLTERKYYKWGIDGEEEEE